MERVLEIDLCLEVLIITPTKGSAFQGVSFKCACIWLRVLGPNIPTSVVNLIPSQTSCLRIILGVSRIDRVSNDFPIS